MKNLCRITIIITDTIRMLSHQILSEKKLRISDSYLMKRTDPTTNIKLKLAPLETKSAGENKSALHFKERLASRTTKPMLSEKMQITSNTNSANSEKRRQRTRTRSTDLEMASPSKKKSVKIMMLRSRPWTTIYSRLKRDLTNSRSWLIPRNSNLEEQTKQWTPQTANLPGAKMTIQD